MRNGFKILTTFAALLAIACIAPRSWAAFGTDTEKPAPQFQRENGAILASLIPRGKSTKVKIRFAADSGKLLNVSGMDFEAAARPGVDVKDFRSALFVIEVGGLTPGADARVSIESKYFNTGTSFWAFNANVAPAWRNAHAENVALSDDVNELVVRVKDGGPMDSDGMVNGAVRLVGGPLDSFWGYAIGTLFIRFFGIFLVLCVLMIGMLISSRVFQFLEKRKAAGHSPPAPPGTAPPAADRTAPDAESGPDHVSPELAAAVTMALHLHLDRGRQPVGPALPRDTAAAWAAQGRAMIMSGRLDAFKRPHKRGPL